MRRKTSTLAAQKSEIEKLRGSGQVWKGVRRMRLLRVRAEVEEAGGGKWGGALRKTLLGGDEASW